MSSIKGFYVVGRHQSVAWYLNRDEAERTARILNYRGGTHYTVEGEIAMPRTDRHHVQCPDCNLVAINGVLCHETGCPSREIDPMDGKPYARGCLWCGTETRNDDSFCGEDCREGYFA